MKKIIINNKYYGKIELQELDMFIELRKLLSYNSDEVIELKKKIGFVNDNTHVNLNIFDSLILFNKKLQLKLKKVASFSSILNLQRKKDAKTYPL